MADINDFKIENEKSKKVYILTYVCYKCLAAIEIDVNSGPK